MTEVDSSPVKQETDRINWETPFRNPFAENEEITAETKYISAQIDASLSFPADYQTAVDKFSRCLASTSLTAANILGLSKYPEISFLPLKEKYHAAEMFSKGPNGEVVLKLDSDFAKQAIQAIHKKDGFEADQILRTQFELAHGLYHQRQSEHFLESLKKSSETMGKPEYWLDRGEKAADLFATRYLQFQARELKKLISTIPKDSRSLIKEMISLTEPLLKFLWIGRTIEALIARVSGLVQEKSPKTPVG